jgi:DNA-binding PadR family transcriptional regulator
MEKRVHVSDKENSAALHPGRALGLIQVAVLSVIVSRPNQAYGTAIADAVSKMIGREVVRAQVYMALQRLDDRGFVTNRTEELSVPSKRTKGRPRIFYQITALGQKALNCADSYFPSNELAVRC